MAKMRDVDVAILRVFKDIHDGKLPRGTSIRDIAPIVNRSPSAVHQHIMKLMGSRWEYLEQDPSGGPASHSITEKGLAYLASLDDESAGNDEDAPG